MTEEVAPALAEALRGQSKLVRLNLNDTSLKDEGILAIAEVSSAPAMHAVQSLYYPRGCDLGLCREQIVLHACLPATCFVFSGMKVAACDVAGVTSIQRDTIACSADQGSGMYVEHMTVHAGAASKHHRA